MAVLHVAYTFQPQSFLDKLKQELVVAGNLHYDSLITCVRRIVSEASDDTKRALQMIRYDPDLVTNAKSDPRQHARELFVVALVGALTPVTSLGTRQRESYFVLQKALPRLGWEKIRSRLRPPCPAVRGPSPDRNLGS